MPGQRRLHRSSPPDARYGLQTIAVLWYAHAGQADTDLTVRRTQAPWYRQKAHISMIDILAAFRRARIEEVLAAQAWGKVFVGDGVAWEATAA